MATVTTYLTVKGGAAALEFYKKAFGAVELARMATPDGRLMHARFTIGDSEVMLSDEFPEYPGHTKSPTTLGGTTVTVHVNSADVDKTMATAVAAGATVEMPAADMFWGDRYGKLVDPFGHSWSVATKIKEMSLEEMRVAGEAFSKNFAKKKG